MSNLSLSKRLQHYVGLVIFSAFVLGWVTSTSNESTLDQLSIATAYICVSLMAVALIIGPLRTYWFASNKNSINIYIRRDIGIWTALSGLAHLYLATVQSMNSSYIEQYVDVSGASLSESVRGELFLWGSITAFIVGILLLLLLCLSSDAALRLLGVRIWKRLQRLAYFAFALTVVHGVMFQLLEGRTFILVALLTVICLGVLLIQTAGFVSVRKNISAKKE